jgi:hypothetical protein
MCSIDGGGRAAGGARVRAAGDGAPTMRLRIASDDLDVARRRAGTLVNLEYAGRRLARDRIEFAPTKAKYLRLSWSAHQPSSTSAVAGEVGDRAVEMPRQCARRLVRRSRKRGDHEFDLGGAFPVNRIAIELPERNSVVPAELFRVRRRRTRGCQSRRRLLSAAAWAAK